MTARPVSDLSWQQALHRVLSDESAVVLHRQPIVDLVRGVTAGFELLARFSDPVVEGPPHHWFDAAYRLGLGPQLEAAVVRQALRLREEMPPDTFLTVNLDPAALVCPDVAGLLLGEERLDRLVLELTEHSEIEDLEHLKGLLARVRERGALVAVDDTGTGYSGLARLLAVRPEFVKVDQAFVRGIAQDPAKRALLELVGHFASRIDAWVIAEGIETEEDLREVIGLGVPLGQGYLLNRPAAEFRPVPAAVRELVERWAGRNRLLHGVGRLAEPAATAPADGLEAAEAACAEVLVDAAGRPVRVRHGSAWVRAMAVAAEDACGVVAARAMVRPEEERWSPVVVTNAAGKPEGVVRIERLVAALAAEAGQG
ncbi:EAL domain-containing protein [Tepidiforma sp.]|uniref:EAL domain-containing protein n=1 Tax=Tepidiforma sp. TaxID=2682230 RepID=UPI0025892A77|nr:EAL domain-containing protein [Tepidiforma sp.]